MKRIFNLFLSLLYPEVCAACGALLQHDEKVVCLSCQYLAPKTGYENVGDNPVARIFWGRVHLHAASATFFFAKKGRIQHLIHELKYKGNQEAGLFLGEEMGKALHQSAFFSDIDVLIPVPLLPKKVKVRGYNQSEIIAKGMMRHLPASLSTHHLVRSVATETQTKKSREARWKNVRDIFVVNRAEEIAGKHLLLIDDVITTGSTIEACAQKLLEIPGVKVSVAAAACAVN